MERGRSCSRWSPSVKKRSTSATLEVTEDLREWRRASE
jgi:hypothetical protein